MCGILAVFGASEEGPGLRSLFVRRLSLLRHRGPDSSGVVVVGNNAVGHERLAVVDPESGHQPQQTSHGASADDEVHDLAGHIVELLHRLTRERTHSRVLAENSASERFKEWQSETDAGSP